MTNQEITSEELKEMQLVKKEEKINEKELNKAINKINFKTTTILEKKFKIISQLVTTLLHSNKINGLILMGKQGIGKSYSSIKCLQENGLEKGSDYEVFQSYTTPLAFYQFLYEHRKDKVLILDDTMGFFNNKINIGIILSALWGEGKRNVHYNSTTGQLKVPKNFIFDSKIIWCINDLPKGTDAVKSRCYNYTLSFSYAEKIEIFYELAKINKIPKGVVDFIKENTDETIEDVDFRFLLKVWEISKINKKDWKEIMLKLIGLSRNEKFALVKKILEESKTTKEAEEKWKQELTKKNMKGGSRRMFYYYKSKVVQ